MIDLVALPLPENAPESVCQKLLERVSPLRRHRVSRCGKESDKLRVLFSELLARSVLMRRLGAANESLRFHYNYYGKPVLEDWDHVHFSVSHSGSWTVAAADDSPVGVDIEHVAPVDDSLARNYFSPGEYADMSTASDPAEYFCVLWTLKESYIKLLGKGLAKPLNSFSIRSPRPGCYRLEPETGEGEAAPFFTAYAVHPGYRLGLCALHPDVPETVEIRTAEALIREFSAWPETGKVDHV